MNKTFIWTKDKAKVKIRGNLEKYIRKVIGSEEIEVKDYLSPSGSVSIMEKRSARKDRV